ncbi:MAG: hypothetical protein VW891_18225, partial [Novosphingobium sp.]
MPLRNSDGLVFPGERQAHPEESSYSTDPRIILKFSDPDVHDIVIDLTSETTLSIRVPRGSVDFELREKHLLRHVFAPPEIVETIHASNIETQLPRDQDDLPECIKLRLAQFAQARLRLHVLASALAHNQASRPIAFSNVTMVECKAEHGHRKPRQSVRCYIHGSSIGCACPAHCLPPCPEGFTAQSVLNIDFCGKMVGKDGRCSLH